MNLGRSRQTATSTGLIGIMINVDISFGLLTAFAAAHGDPHATEMPVYAEILDLNMGHVLVATCTFKVSFFG